MPIHDWTRVEAGIFHAFHHDWITDISRALNGGLLPASYYALPEQLAGGLGPDVLTLHGPPENGTSRRDIDGGGLALAESPPKVRIRMRSDASKYAAKAKAVVIRHVSDHQVVAMVEIVSPGNKNNQHGLQAFVRKAHETLAAGVHLLIADLFPPSVSYIGGFEAEAFVEPLAVGDALPDMPLFLSAERYVPVPLEATYQSAFGGMPAYWRDVLSASPAA